MALKFPISEEEEYKLKNTKINWEEIKKNEVLIHPKRQIAICTLTSSERKCLAWTNIAYSLYNYREFCKFCVEIEIELGENDKKKVKYNKFKMHFKLAEIGKKKLKFEYIENYFSEHFSGICTALVLHIETTKKGFKVEIYVDNTEEAKNKLDAIKLDKNRIFNFNFKITEDENWDIIGMMLY